jgi:hypothetical protein
VTVRTVGAARLTTFCAMSGSLSPASVKSRTTSSGRLPDVPLLRDDRDDHETPPAERRADLLVDLHERMVEQALDVEPVRSFRMPLATNAVAMATRRSTTQRWRTMKRT